MDKLFKSIPLSIILFTPLMSFGQVSTLKELVTLFNVPFQEIESKLDTCYKTNDKTIPFHHTYYCNEQDLSFSRDRYDTTQIKAVSLSFDDATFVKIFAEFSNYGLVKYKPWRGHRKPNHIYYECPEFSIVYVKYEKYKTVLFGIVQRGYNFGFIVNKKAKKITGKN